MKLTTLAAALAALLATGAMAAPPDYQAEADSLLAAAGPPQRSRAAMCQDALDLQRRGDNSLMAFHAKHCVAKQVDALTLERARDCKALRGRAVAGDPVAAYDYAQAREARLCQ